MNKATEKLFPVANTPQAILDLGLDGLKSYIKTIGLFNSKAENIIKTCRDLIEKHNGEVPENREALEALAGVGRKTANVVPGSNDDEVAKIEALIKQRNEARTAKDWSAADSARNELTAMGIVLEDGPNGTTWRKQ